MSQLRLKKSHESCEAFCRLGFMSESIMHKKQALIEPTKSITHETRLRIDKIQ
jgi:hypothetical protein